LPADAMAWPMMRKNEHCAALTQSGEIGSDQQKCDEAMQKSVMWRQLSQAERTWGMA